MHCPPRYAPRFSSCNCPATSKAPYTIERLNPPQDNSDDLPPVSSARSAVSEPPLPVASQSLPRRHHDAANPAIPPVLVPEAPTRAPATTLRSRVHPPKSCRKLPPPRCAPAPACPLGPETNTLRSVGASPPHADAVLHFRGQRVAEQSRTMGEPFEKSRTFLPLPLSVPPHHERPPARLTRAGHPDPATRRAWVRGELGDRRPAWLRGRHPCHSAPPCANWSVVRAWRHAWGKLRRADLCGPGGAGILDRSDQRSFRP